MSWHLSVRHSIRRLLQAQGLKVHTHTPVWDDEVGIHWTLHTASLLTKEEKKNTNVVNAYGKTKKCVLIIL